MTNEVFESRIQIQQIVQNQLPEFVLDEFPKVAEFLKQYYISQEFQSGSSDISQNLDQYLKLDNLTPEVIVGSTTLTQNVLDTSDVILVESTKGFPKEYGLIKIDDEIITYTGITTTSFTGCVRGFSGITSYKHPTDPRELVFSTSNASAHNQGSVVTNLSSLFLKEFYKKIKFTFTPGLEDVDFVDNLNVNNFIKEARSLYQSKGTEESFKILFKVLYGEEPKVIDLEQYLLKASDSEYVRREVLFVENILEERDPQKLVGQTIRRSKDSTSQASVSEVEILTRGNKVYYKLSLFIGYNEKEFIEGEFKVTGKTKVLEDVNSGDSIISVDSTIGFEQSGTLVVKTNGNTNTINYTDKTTNQFLGCTGIESDIPLTTTVYSDETIYGYENGDLSKKVELRVTGLLSDFIPLEDNIVASESDKIYNRGLGVYIENNLDDPSYKETFANSWIYNTSCRYELKNFTLPTNELVLKAESDKTSLSVGDNIDILERASGEVKNISSVKVTSISVDKKRITIAPAFTPEEYPGSPGRYKDYDIRRKIKKSSSNEVPIKYGNDKIIANVQNLYIDTQENGYIAANGLPEYIIQVGLVTAFTSGTVSLQNFNEDNQSFSAIKFPNFSSTNIPFITGDAVVYRAEKENSPIVGLVSGSRYYIEVLSNDTIRLFESRSSIGSNAFVELRQPLNGSGQHTFVLGKDRSNSITIRKNLKKFPLNQNLQNGLRIETNSGPVGVLVNGVEIVNTKSVDKVYYGPIKSISLLNPGDGYDVVNPPGIVISAPDSGTQALAQAVVRGTVENVLVDPQDFDIEGEIYVKITGGNGSGAVLSPIIASRSREVVFDGRTVLDGGGVNIDDETITFTSNHNLIDGEVIVYDSNNNDPIGIGTYFGENKVLGKSLSTNSQYYANVISSNKIRIYNNLSDYTSGINTVGFTTENTSGLHKFKTLEKNTLKDIKVINSGYGYENKKIYVKASGISSETSSIYFENHKFNDGDVVIYSYGVGENSILGLSTSTQYKVLKINDNKFRLSDAGSDGSDNTNYTSRNYVTISSTGSGFQCFQYPPITVSVTGPFIDESKKVTATPIVKGQIVDTLLYETGTGYGSTILNFEKKPIVRITSGKEAEVVPVIKNGKIVDVNISFGGYEYYSVPDLVVSGSGFGAVLRAVVENQKIVNVIIIRSGDGYDSNTKITVTPRGKNALADVRIRDLSISERDRYGNNEFLVEVNNELRYGILSYPRDLASYLNVSENNYSPIIGWAYDGNPIYGPYAPSDPNNLNSPISVMKTGYILDKNNVFDRPNVSDSITFVEDYVFDNSGDLDEHNGRFAKTLEFPNGVYAYYATINDFTLEPEYPYFIGKTYRSNIIEDNFLPEQYYDYAESDLIRNTFPYCSNRAFVSNDFIDDPNKFTNELATVESITTGTIDSFTIISSGDNYKVGDRVLFNENGTGDGGIESKVSEIKGKDIVSIASSTLSYANCVLVWGNNNIKVKTPTNHDLKNDEFVSISGVTTYINNISGTRRIGVLEETSNLIDDIPSGSVGLVTDIHLSYIPESITSDSIVKIDEEELSVLNVFSEDSILRVKRSGISSYSSRSEVSILQDSFTLPIRTNFFDSKVNEKVYFNPKISVGVGTTSGLGISTSVNVGITSRTIELKTQSIYLPNHPFKTGQQVLFTKGPSVGSTISVANTETSTPFTLPFNSGDDTQLVYVINKSKDYIGITTLVGFTTNTNGLFFIDNGKDDYEYSLQSQYTQVKCTSSRIKSTVAVSTNHNLSVNDTVKINAIPNISTGIGSSDKIRISYNSQYDKLLFNPIGFTSSSVDKNNDKITLPLHGFKTGDKVFYDVTSGQVISGLNTGSYYVYKISDNEIHLGKTLYDVSLSYPNIVGITSEGGNNHRLSLINPQVLATKNSQLVFDKSSSSLSGYDLNIFYDQNFNNDFVSTTSDKEFNVISIGSSVIINYTDNMPSRLYYAISKDGEIISPDIDVNNYNEILYINSSYNGKYNVIGIGTTTFEICLERQPEATSYTPNETLVLEYTTNSTSSSGPISNISLISKGSNYKKIPEFIEVDSESGSGFNISLNSNNIGRIKNIRLSEQVFNYPSDKTLNPSSRVSPTLILRDMNTISNIEVVKSGTNYVTAPNLIVYDVDNQIVVDTDSLSCKLISGSIDYVTLNKSPYGLKDSVHKIIAINNTNGVKITDINKVSNTVFDAIISTPLSGYLQDVFSTGDLVFVEGIKTTDGSGTGFNSSDYGYEFFEVVSFTNSIPAKVRFNLSKFTANIGTVDSINLSSAIVNKNNYPEFNIIKTKALYKNGEQLNVNSALEDLFVADAGSGYIKIFGRYTPKTGDILTGKNSGVISTVENVILNEGKFVIDYYNKRNYGWNSNSGKLNESYQVCPDNDYYQNLSYTVKSKIEYENMIDPVNRLLHTAGLKNFSDTEVISSSTVGIGFTASDTAVLDVIQEKRVDTIYNFDLGVDIDSAENTSKYIKLKNRKISDYFKCLSNKVLIIDDISPFFDDSETNQTLIYQQYSDIGFVDSNYTRHLIQIVDPETNDTELSEIISLINGNDIFILEKGSLSNTENRFGSFAGVLDESGSKIIRFIPSNIYDNDYDIKILSTSFNNLSFSNANTSIGFANLVSYKNTVSIGQTYTIASFDKTQYNSYFAQVHVQNIEDDTNNYVEIFVSHNDDDVSSAEYYFDDDTSTSKSFIETFEPKIVSNQLKLDFYNNDSNNSDVIVNAKVVGFGSTSVGIATYRFKNDFEENGDERSAIIQANFETASSVVDVIKIDKDLFSSVKSLVKVSYGQTSVLHQTMMVHNGQDTYILEYPFVSIGATTGIGTFGSIISGTNVIMKFYVDANVSSSVDVQSYNEVLYKSLDFSNEPSDLTYGSVIESVDITRFNALNGDRISQVAFEMEHKNKPIFVKSFNPKDSLNLASGVFTIKNHFFSTGEKVLYTEGTTTGSSSPIKINPSYSVPSEIYIYTIDEDNFGISTTKANSLSGICVTFTSYGAGNRHEFEMEKKNEKSVISIDGVVQQPLTYTSIVYNLFDNGGTVSASSTYFSISGISTIRSGDLLKISNEYMKITSVGLGTTSVGPITETGNYNILNVERGFFNSNPSTHSDGTQLRIYKGSYNIVKNKVYFARSPRGGGKETTNQSNLRFPTSTFGGRIYLQSDYSNNKIYDDISPQFTGVGLTFTLTNSNQNIIGIGTGNGFVFINDVFQTPSTENNTGNNYSILEDQISGISSVSFTGIKTTTESSPIIVDYDINRNELPRGGIIVSLGSTSGLGFAPLVGASVTAIVGAGGTIVSVGIGSTDINGSGYNGQVSVAITDSTGYGASIRANIGVGGTLSFSVLSQGTNYTNPTVIVSPPSYNNLSTIGVYRAGIGSTTITGNNLKLNIVVGASSTTGVGSGYYEVQSFSISNPGYDYEIGDIIKPVGLVTDARIASPLIDCEFVVTETFTDSFYGMQLGEFDYIDSIKSLQDGVRKTFPILYNNELRSIEINKDDPISSSIDLSANLLIFINGVIQEPNQSYTFDGGTSFTFDVAPRSEDNVDIFFYQGKRGIDVIQENIVETIKYGDDVQLLKNDLYPNTVSQNTRIVDNIKSSDEIETNLYVGLGVNNLTYRPISWTKQKVDKVIGGKNVYKSRGSLESLIFPTANIIANLSTTDSRIFVDNSELFRSDNESEVSGIIIPNPNSQIEEASFEATVNTQGEVATVNITNPGFGYTQSTLSLKFAPPSIRGIGIGTTSAQGTVTIVNGSVTSVSISSAGAGYSVTSPPQVILESPPNLDYEIVTGITSVKGFSGLVVGIQTVSIGSSNGIRFDLLVDDQYDSWMASLQRGYPVVINETTIGSPRSSLNIGNLSVVGVGTTFLDNIYVVHTISAVGVKTASMLSYINSSVTGISTYNLNGVGRFSWGSLENASRSQNPIQLSPNGFTVNSGLSTYPIIQRRNSGLRNTGSLNL